MLIILLKDYDYSKNGAYFVTIGAQNMVHLFGEISGKTPRGCPNKGGKVIEKWLRKIQTKYNGVIIDK